MTNPKGRFGIHGGQYIPETLINAVIELEEAYEHYKNDPEFNRELTELLNEYAGRPSRLYYAKKMTRDLGGAKIYLKREDLNHTGAHKINNVLGQALLAKKMGKTRLIAETGAGQHGVATATAAALMGMECVVFMGEEDTVRQALNVYRMRLLGATVVPVTSGTATLKDAVSEAMREWTSRIADTHYCLGSVMGPHPFPTIVRDFQAVISKEIKEQMLAKEGRLPDAVVACVGGGSNAIGSFYHFIDDNLPGVSLRSPHPGRNMSSSPRCPILGPTQDPAVWPAPAAAYWSDQWGIALHQFRHCGHICQCCNGRKLLRPGDLLRGIRLPERTAGHLCHFNVVGHQPLIHVADEVSRLGLQRNALPWSLTYVFHIQ